MITNWNQDLMKIFQQIIDWTNTNSGFVSIILFIATILYGWLSGLFNSLIKKPKLKIRFIDKLSFYSYYKTGTDYYNEELNETYDVHKTGFVVYMSIVNVGNMATSIDKIYMAYYKNKQYPWYRFIKEKVWLAQWHSIDSFVIPIKNERSISVKSLRIRSHEFDNSNTSFINIGDSLIGVAYFEQQEAWGNFSPLPNDDISANIIIKIEDVYGRKYKFKTKLKYMDLEKAKTYNPHFGNIEYLTMDK